MNAIIQTPTIDIKQSLDFYERLNFKVISKENPCIVTDGKAIVEINPDRVARAGIKLFQDSWESELKILETLVNVTPLENGHLLADPSGTWIYLMEGASGIEYQRTEACFGMTGSYAGVSLETTDMAQSLKIWEALHFSISMGDPNKGWVTLANKEMTVSLMKPLMCPHLFFNPSLTYFNGKVNNPIIIQQVRATEIPITEEITHFNKNGEVDNIIVRDPGGLGFFLFNDG